MGEVVGAVVGMEVGLVVRVFWERDAGGATVRLLRSSAEPHQVARG